MVNNSLFKLEEIPNYHPITQSFYRKQFWEDQRRRCIEGHWQSGKWMPGPLYYYINFHHIQIEDERAGSRKLGLPWLRDVEWEFFLLYEECRGFSGFELDTKYTCHRHYGPQKEEALRYGWVTQKELDSRTYIEARDYLRKNHGENLGKPLYKNSAKNFNSFCTRGLGKSYTSSALAAHNHLFDGAFDYDYWLEQKSKAPLASDTIVGAIDTKYTIPLISKITTAYKYLPGKFTLGDKVYHSPLLPQVTGSAAPNRDLSTSRGSKLRHRTFKDNPFAANGTRPNLTILDEIGFLDNVSEAWPSIEAASAAEGRKTQVIWSLGTGGFVKGKAALYAKDIFENPNEYDCISFEDIWENRKNPIGYFVPYTYSRNEFKKKPNLITDLESANKYAWDKREELSKGKNLKTVYAKIINMPMKPSECFLNITGNLFPTADLQELLGELEGKDKYRDGEYIGELIYSKSDTAINGIKWKPNDALRPLYDYPVNKSDPNPGCLVIYQHPYVSHGEKEPQWGRYIAGTDPVAQDSSNTDSLGSTLVYDRFTNRIVAEFTARPTTTKEYYEQVSRICKYYNCRVLYENQIKGLFDYFESKQLLQYVLPQPEKIKDIHPDSKVSRGYGMHMTEPLKSEGERMIRDWLLDKVDEETTNLHYIRCIPLVKELIQYSPEINTDRCIALMMIMYHLAEVRMVEVKEVERVAVRKFTDSGFFSKGLGPKSYNSPTSILKDMNRTVI